MILKLSASAAVLAMMFASQAAAAGLTPKQAAGRRIAKTYCAECHAIGPGRSPLADAPPFRDLHKRFPKGGGLNDLLAKGMIASDAPQEEGEGPPRHPRMPQVRLDEAQIGDLTAYIQRLQQTRR